MQVKGDLRQKANALWEAAQSGDKTKTKRVFDDFVRDIADGIGNGGTGTPGGGVSDTGTRKSKVPQQIIDAAAGVTKNPVAGNDIPGGESDQLKTAVIKDGSTVTHADSVNVIGGVAQRATGTLPVSGFCVRAKGNSKEIIWQAGGAKVHARVKRVTSVVDYGVLYQSATPGVLTNDPTDGTGQQVGTFEHWVNQPDGRKPGIAVITPQIGPPGAITLPVDAEVDDFLYFDGTKWTGRLIDASDIQTGILPVVHGGTGLGVVGTAGQVLATKSDLTGLEWVDQTGGGSSVREHRTSAFVGIPETSGQVIGKVYVQQLAAETTRTLTLLSAFAGDAGSLDTSTYSDSVVSVTDGTNTASINLGSPGAGELFVFASSAPGMSIDVSSGSATLTISAGQWIGHGNLSIEVEIE